MALGCIGLSFDDFCRLTFEEFEQTVQGWNDIREGDYRNGWEQIRILAFISIQPHIKKKITPKQLLPLPWDKTMTKKGKQLTKEERLKRFEKIKHRLDDIK